MKSLVCVLLVTVWIFIQGAKNVEQQVSTACYGVNPDCDYYTIECSEDQIIRLENLYAGYKNNNICKESYYHCNNSNICCSSADGDFKEAFNLKNTYDTYANCSANQQCIQVHAPWQLLKSPPTVATSYVEIGYSCVKDETISLCNTSGTLNVSSSVDLIYNGATDERLEWSDIGKACHCVIGNNHSSDVKMKIRIIEIRMLSYFRESNEHAAKCSSAVLSSSFGLTASCVPTNHSGVDNFLYNERHRISLKAQSEHTMTLHNLFKLGPHDAPARIWLSLEVDNDDDDNKSSSDEEDDSSTSYKMTIECKEVVLVPGTSESNEST